MPMMFEYPIQGCCTAKIIVGMGGTYAGYLNISHKIMKYSDLTDKQKENPRIVEARNQFFNELLDMRSDKKDIYKDFADCSLIIAITTATQDLGADCLREAGWTPHYTGTKDQPEQREKYTGGLTLWCIEPKNYIAWKEKYREELKAAKAEKAEERKARFSVPKEEPVVEPVVREQQPVVEAPRRVPSFTIRNLVAAGYLPETVPGSTFYRNTALTGHNDELRTECCQYFGVTIDQWADNNGIGLHHRRDVTLREFNERMRACQEANGVR